MYTYFLLFMIYSFLGWCIEVISKLIEKKKFVNRGFLIGPLCPIYGFGSLFAIYFLSKYQERPVIVFILSLFLFSIIEYLTSVIMEKIFNTRWWDYSNYKYNINGRVCLNTIIPFGICGVLLICIINPLFIKWLNMTPNILKIVVSITLFIIFVIDIIISYVIISKIKSNNISTKDSTEEINKKVEEYLSSGKILDRRLIHAFPNMQVLVKSAIKR